MRGHFCPDFAGLSLKFAGPQPSAGLMEAQEPLFASVEEGSPAPAKSPVRINEPLDFELKGLQPNHHYLTSRGFSARTVRHFGLGYCSRGLMAGRIAIPFHDTDGRLVGYADRIVDDSRINKDCPKYKFPPKRDRNGVVHEFHKSHLVYNAHRIKGPVDRLVVVEGFPSVWWLHQAGIESAVALMGWSCSPEQAAILLAKTSASARIFSLPDGDEAGDRCAHGVFGALGHQRWVRWTRLPSGRQPTDCPPAELTEFFRA
jgi:DNA primase